MLSNKRYLGTSLVTQMILIPSLLTIGLIFLPLTDQFSEYGNDAKNLILLLIAFWGSLTVGGGVGYCFARLSKHKPDSAKERYLPALVPILYALIFAIFALIFSLRVQNCLQKKPN